jgi:hypothetical protein
MYSKSTDDIAQTLMHMQERARIDCKFDQYAMARRMAEFMANDRRFDGIANKEAFAREAMDARSHGRQLDLTERVGSGANTTSGYIMRKV